MTRRQCISGTITPNTHHLSAAQHDNHQRTHVSQPTRRHTRCSQAEVRTKSSLEGRRRLAGIEGAVPSVLRSSPPRIVGGVLAGGRRVLLLRESILPLSGALRGTRGPPGTQDRRQSGKLLGAPCLLLCRLTALDRQRDRRAGDLFAPFPITRACIVGNFMSEPQKPLPGAVTRN